MIPAGVVPVPTDGVWLSTEPSEGPRLTYRSIVIAGLQLSVLETTGPTLDPVLTIASQLGDPRAPTVVRLGLGADPTIARTILFSIRPAD